MKKIIREYFVFSRKELVALAVLATLMAAFIGYPYLLPVKNLPSSVIKPGQQVVMEQQVLSSRPDSSSRSPSWTAAAEAPATASVTKAVLFEFDPNTITAAEWIRLGLREKTARTIINYRAKGGKFKIPEDIRKIWGLQKADADRIIPYARITALPPTVTRLSQGPAEKVYTNRQEKTMTIIDINTATIEEWKTLRGIGEVLANRIVRFREKTGGFVSVQQVGRTYGLKDSVFQTLLPYLKMDSTRVK